MTITDPMTSPLTYPGDPPGAAAAVVLSTGTMSLRRTAAGWAAVTPQGPAPLDPVLTGARTAPMAARRPVLAVGSNASPAQLARKFAMAGAPLAVPLTAAAVTGVTVGVSAHVSQAGYLPAAPVPDPAAVRQLHITWLDAAGLAVMDATEPNYHRVTLDHGCTVLLPGGHEVTGCEVYVSRHGWLARPAGQPVLLTPQPALIEMLLRAVPRLRDLAGGSAAEWITRMKDEQVRENVRALLRQEGWVVGGAWGCPPAWPASDK